MGNAPLLCQSDSKATAVVDVADADDLVCVHQYLFPMYVVKVSDFLQMQGAPQAHHALKEKGLLYEWQPGMFTVFVSHQWLGARMPDPLGQHVKILREVLQQLKDKSLKVEADFTRQAPGSATSYEQVADGYLFLDWFAIPQITARTQGVNEDATRSDAALAVQSIPAYVEACNMFVALVPEAVHMDTGLQCNYNTWLSRGWCRAELWCRLLSNRKDTSVVVIFSVKEALYIVPSDWQRNLIADGLFTVESDRAQVVKLGEMAMASKIQHLRQWGPMSQYRFYLARSPQLLNQKRVTWELWEFLQHFHFPDIESAIKEECGMTGMLCAVLAGDVNIMQQLVERRANPNARVCGLSDIGYYDTQTLLMTAVKSSQDSNVLSALMSMHADPNAVSRLVGYRVAAAWLAQTPDQIKTLLEYRAQLVGTQPLNGVAGRASTETVKSFLESRCDPSYLPKEGYLPLHAVGFFGRANPHACDTVRILLSFRADVNAQTDPQGPLYWDCVWARVQVSLWGMESSVYQRKMACLPGATPLSVAAMMGDKTLVQLLLDNDAEVEISNHRGDTAEDLAKVSGHTHLLPILCTFSV